MHTECKKTTANTVSNTLISHDFLVWTFCGNAQFLQSLADLPETLVKLCYSAKFPHQENMWNYGILRNEGISKEGTKIQNHDFVASETFSPRRLDLSLQASDVHSIPFFTFSEIFWPYNKIVNCLLFSQKSSSRCFKGS